MPSWQDDVEGLRKQASDKMREAADLLALASQEKAANGGVSGEAIIEQKVASIYTNLLFVEFAKAAAEAHKSTAQASPPLYPTPTVDDERLGLVARSLALRSL